jgi:hypothetical protein
MGNAIVYRMPFGVPGDLSRLAAQATVEGQIFGATAFTAYGVPVKLSSGTVIPAVGSGDAIYGFLVRPFPVTGASASDPLGTAVPPATGMANVLRRGYLNVYVQLGAATCALGSAVYFRTASASGGQPLGGIEGATSGNNTAITGAAFMGPADANGMAEIAYNL